MKVQETVQAPVQAAEEVDPMSAINAAVEAAMQLHDAEETFLRYDYADILSAKIGAATRALYAREEIARKSRSLSVKRAAYRAAIAAQNKAK